MKIGIALKQAVEASGVINIAYPAYNEADKNVGGQLGQTYPQPVPSFLVTQGELEALFARFFPTSYTVRDGDCTRMSIPFSSPDVDFPRLLLNMRVYSYDSGQDPMNAYTDPSNAPLTVQLSLSIEAADGRTITDPMNDKALDGNYAYMEALRGIGSCDPMLYVFKTDFYDREKFVCRLREAAAGYNIFLTRWGRVSVAPQQTATTAMPEDCQPAAEGC